VIWSWPSGVVLSPHFHHARHSFNIKISTILVSVDPVSQTIAVDVFNACPDLSPDRAVIEPMNGVLPEA